MKIQDLPSVIILTVVCKVADQRVETVLNRTKTLAYAAHLHQRGIQRFQYVEIFGGLRSADSGCDAGTVSLQAKLSTSHLASGVGMHRGATPVVCVRLVR